ncbi:MAG: serine/threonine protein kinase [Pirellulaceae bacterium]|nr:serine/threonine protein kinase [Pirellulaceae bacterium]
MGSGKLDKERIFNIAAEIQDPAKRAAYLDDSCGDDALLREEVEALLRRDQDRTSFFDSSSAGLDATIDHAATAEPGAVIGPYKLLQQIGEGGFGVVYMAAQTEPFKRRVALKIIKPGMDTRQVVARFEAERQALAMMDHPNIAKVLDAGVTGSGRPYFVMELVKGVPITQFCDEKQLSPRQRLELFVPVCHAIQHAHQKGIIHRDLKPSNVLVAEYDDRPVPKVIDFGVAKATEQRLTEKTLFTQFGQIMGTVDYMSPEQAKLNQLDIDTRSDIYSLGVMLYELLTGDTPFDRQRLHSAAFDELLRIIREEEPPKPSMRLSNSHSLPAVAAKRHVEPKQLSSLMRGELDWVVMKALEKDRTRRYETANEFANDIQRYLNDEPVVACPPSAAYRFRKFARRNKVAFTTALLVMAALIVGIIGTTWQSIRATRQRDRAVKAELLAGRRYESELNARRLVEHERDRAVAAEMQARAVNQFINDDLLSQADPERGSDREIKLRTVVDRASEKVAGRFGNQPLVKAAVHNTLARTYQGLGEYREAERHGMRAWEIRREALGEKDPETLNAMNNLARSYEAQGRYDKAEPLYETTVELCLATQGPEHPDTLTSMNNLAMLRCAQGRYKDAEPLLLKILEIQRRRARGEGHPATLTAMHNLALLYQAQTRYDAAQPLCEDVFETIRRLKGDEDPRTLTAMDNLAGLYRKQDRLQDAEPLYMKALDTRRRVLGPEHPETLRSMTNLALLYDQQGRHGKAELLLKETLKTLCRVGEENPETLRTMNNLAAIYDRQGRYKLAEPLHAKTLEIQLRMFDEDHPHVLISRNSLAQLYTVQGRHGEAEPLLVKILESQRRLLGAEHPKTLTAMENLVECLAAQDRLDEAEPMLRETLALCEKAMPDDWRRFQTMSLLGATLMAQARVLRATNAARAEEQFVEAEPLLVSGYEGMKQREAQIPAPVKADRLAQASRRLIELYDTWGKPDDAARWREEMVQPGSADRPTVGEPPQLDPSADAPSKSP